MPLSALVDQSHEPTDQDLRDALGRASKVWTALITAVAERIGPISQVWSCTSKSAGWGLRLRLRDRIILYMKPQTGYFLVSFALGEKAVAAAHRFKLPAAVLKALDAAPRYAEGRGVRFEVSKRSQVDALATLAEVKHQN